MGQKIRSHHAALHHSFQSASQYTGGSMQLVRGACHGLLAPTRNTHARTWLLKRKQERAGMKEMPLFFHLGNAKGLPQVLQSISARSSDTWVCCKHDALRSHEYKSDCLHIYHVLGPSPPAPARALKGAAKNPPPGFAGKGWEHKTATRHLQDLEYFVFSTSTCTSWASLLLPPIVAKRTESSVTVQCPEICILQKLHLFLSIRNKPSKPELIHEHFFSRNSSQGIL